ncbi:hypothetical protein COO59_06935 [Mixta theicola]|uniref:Uncharacterized protein n=1 Tax=Mixta theicola TaxID=1458355 RepID=A0A2K1QB47_9GAMM|nr:hypothetical protein COO59_06935 [Mixta theicola]
MPGRVYAIATCGWLWLAVPVISGRTTQAHCSSSVILRSKIAPSSPPGRAAISVFSCVRSRCFSDQDAAWGCALCCAAVNFARPNAFLAVLIFVQNLKTGGIM